MPRDDNKWSRSDWIFIILFIIILVASAASYAYVFNTELTPGAN